MTLKHSHTIDKPVVCVVFFIDTPLHGLYIDVKEKHKMKAKTKKPKTSKTKIKKVVKDDKKEIVVRSRGWFFSSTIDFLSEKTIKSAILECGPNEWAYVLHDKDVLANGELKPSHYHVFIYFVNPRTIQSVAKSFGLAENFINKSSNPNGAKRYLCHKDDPEKYQYPEDDVKASFDYKAFMEETSKGAEPTDIYEAFEMVRNGEMDTKAFFSRFKTLLSSETVNGMLSIYTRLKTLEKEYQSVEQELARNTEKQYDFKARVLKGWLLDHYGLIATDKDVMDILAGLNIHF